MAVEVRSLKQGEPIRSGDLLIWQHFQSVLSLRVLELHGEATLHNDERDEVLYVIEENRGIYIPAGESLHLAGEITIVSSLAPKAGGDAGTTRSVALNDQPMQKTGDRWYRELIQAEITQFVGSIPPGRAPDHFHLYEEVMCVLEGTGVVWAGQSSTPIGTGSCIFLPKRQIHCVENTGPGDLRLLGMFYPAGSPAVRYEVQNSADR
jgi:mannose-6-phosphate isomerase-like protein (cupin superfamily)